MPIDDELQPHIWMVLVSTPARIETRHSARKCRRYFRRKREIAVHPGYDRNLELVYAVHARDNGFRIFRKLGDLGDFPIGCDLTIEEAPAGAELQLQFAMPRWFVAVSGFAFVLLLVLALTVMDWWPSLLTLAVLALIALVALHTAATDRRELERFLVGRFAENEAGEFREEEWEM